MEAKDYRWIITVDEHGPKVEIVRPSGVVDAPHMECPSAKMPKQEWDSGIYLNKKKGTILDFIRVIYTLCRSGFFVDSNGNKIPDYKVFQSFGILLHNDFSNYHVNLNSSLQDGKSEAKHLQIFRKMSDIMKQKYDMA